MVFESSDIITTDGYLNLCEEESLDLCHIKTDYFFIGNFNWRGKNHPEILKKNAIVSHSDLSVDDSISNKFNLVFCVNNHSTNKNTFSLPLGVPNDCDDIPLLKIIGNKDNFLKLANEPIEKKFLLYSNFNLNTNSNLRTHVSNLFKSFDWVLKQDTIQTMDGWLNYLHTIKQSKFVLCPPGNGVDTHRLWETLYMGSIPITTNHKTYETCEDLPVLFVEKWEDINESFLNEKFEIFKRKTFKLEKLKLSYWKKYIKSKISENV